MSVASGVTFSLGLLNLVCTVDAAVDEDKSSSLRTLCANGHNPTPIRQKWLCPACGSEGPHEKGREVGDGVFVIVPPEVIAEQAEAKAAFKKNVTLTVHPAEEIADRLLPSGKSYYLSQKQPGENQRKVYTLLSHLVRHRSDVAVMAKYTLRSSTSVFQLVCAGEHLVLRQMADATLVRQRPEVQFEPLDSKQLALGDSVVDMLLEPFLATDHGSGVVRIIEEYANAAAPVGPAVEVSVSDVAAASPDGVVVDFTAQLEAIMNATSVAKAKAAGRAGKAKASAKSERKAS